MSILLVMLPLTLLSAGALLALFAWAVRDGQFEALEDAKHRIFFKD
jgi:cbb3-type cytochrome oxidase maturation protein